MVLDSDQPAHYSKLFQFPTPHQHQLSTSTFKDLNEPADHPPPPNLSSLPDNFISPPSLYFTINLTNSQLSSVPVHVTNIVPHQLHVLIKHSHLTIIKFDCNILTLQLGKDSESVWVGLSNGDIFLIDTSLILYGTERGGEDTVDEGLITSRSLRVHLDSKSKWFILNQVGLRMIRELPSTHNKSIVSWLLIYSSESLPPHRTSKDSVFTYQIQLSSNGCEVKLMNYFLVRWQRWGSWVPLLINKEVSNSKSWGEFIYESWDKNLLSEMMILHIVTTQSGVVYTELTSPITESNPLSTSLFNDIVWSVSDEVIGMCFSVTPQFIITVGVQGVLTAIELTKWNDTSRWIPKSQSSIPSTKPIIQWQYFPSNSLQMDLILLDSQGELYHITFDGNQFHYHGVSHHYNILSLFNDSHLMGSPLPTVTYNPKLYGISLSGELFQINLTELQLIQPSLSGCLETLQANDHQEIKFHQSSLELDKQLEIIYQSLQLTQQLHSNPDLISVTIIPYTSSITNQLHIKLQTTIKFPIGWIFYVKLSQRLPYNIEDFNSSNIWHHDIVNNLDLNDSSTWEINLPTDQLTLPLLIEGGLRFTLPQTIREDEFITLGNVPETNLPICRTQLDILNFALANHELQLSNRLMVENIIHSKLTSPLLPNHPFNATNLNLNLLSIPSRLMKDDYEMKLTLNSSPSDNNELHSKQFLGRLVWGDATLLLDSIKLTIPSHLLPFPNQLPPTVTINLQPTHTNLVELIIKSHYAWLVLSVVDGLLGRLLNPPFQFKIKSSSPERDVTNLWLNYITNHNHTEDHNVEGLMNRVKDLIQGWELIR